LPSKKKLKTVQTEAPKRQPEPKVRKFGGFKAKLVVAIHGINVGVDVRYARITSREADEQLQIVARSAVTGKLCFREKVVNINGELLKPLPTRFVWIDEDGNLVAKEDVKYFQVLEDGTEVEVMPFKRTKRLEAVKLIPMSRVDEFLQEKIYEMWAEDSKVLFGLADELRKRDMAVVVRLSFGGFIEYYGLVYPIFKDGKFVMVMVLTRMKKVFSRWMDVNGETLQMRKRTVSVLPEI